MKRRKLCPICHQGPVASPKGKACQRCLTIRQKYKVDPKNIVALRRQQRGVCGICEKEPKPDKDFAVDHDHNTGDVRGLLCTPCNVGLGMFGHDPVLLTQAIVYLRRAPQPFSRITTRPLGTPEYNEVREMLFQDTSIPTLRGKARILAAKFGYNEEAVMSNIRRELQRRVKLCQK